MANTLSRCTGRQAEYCGVEETSAELWYKERSTRQTQVDLVRWVALLQSTVAWFDYGIS